jgi:hypothetical protein
MNFLGHFYGIESFNQASAKAVGKGLTIIIDHDEDACQNLYNNECYYTIVV